MIDFISGTIREFTSRGVSVLVNGIGYEIRVSVSDRACLKIGDHVEFFCYMHVREDIMQLYGFLESSGRDFFEVLIGVSGIGPKTSLQILSLGSANDVQSAIERADTEFLTSIPGIGKKLAQRVVLELKGKLVDIDLKNSCTPESDAIDALCGLGYSKDEARRAVRGIEGEAEDIIKQALCTLKKQF